MAGNVVRVAAQVTGAKGAASELDQLKDKFTKLQKQGAKGIGIGAGVAIGNAALNSVGTAISAVTGFLEDSVTAYRAQEVASDRLAQSLKANVAGWNGDMTAIEAANAAGQKLGFDNTDLTNSLAGLVGATHDVGKALDVQGVAMDLARFKGISLADASDALTKVEAGSFRILKSLGIELKAGATQTEALAAVEKLAGGQAQTYANTDLGQIATAAAKVQDAQEKLGKSISQFGAEVLPVAADALTNFVDGLGRFGDETKKENDSLVNFLRYVLMLDPAIEGSANRAAALGLKMAYAADQGDNMSDKMAYLTVKVDDVKDATKNYLPKLDAMKKGLQDSKTAAGELDGYLQDLAGTIGDTKVKQGELAQAQLDLQDLVAQGPDSKRPGAWTAWQGKIADANEKILVLQGELAMAAGPAAFDKWLDTLQTSLGLTNTQAQRLVDLIRATASAAGRLPGLTGQTGRKTTGSGAHKATGGRVMAGEEYTVGELGPERFRPDTNGTIIPHGQSGSSGTTINYNLTVSGDLRARDANEVLATMRRLQAIAT